MQKAAGQLLSSFRARVCGHTKRVLRVTFCSSSIAATRGQRTILVLSTNLCTDVWRLSLWTLSSKPIYYLMVWLLKHRHFLATVLPCLFKDTHASIFGAEVEVSARWGSGTLWIYPAVVESVRFCCILCLWFRASLIYINNCPNEMQHKTVYLLFCKFTVHVSGVSHIRYQEYTNL